MKSPNPNDRKKILVSGSIELEADTLLNGTIYTDKYKQHKLSPRDHRVDATQIRKQTMPKEFRKNFSVSGKHFTAKNLNVLKQFEQLSQIKSKKTVTPVTPEQQQRHLEHISKKLPNLSMDKLEAIYMYMSSIEEKQNAQMIKDELGNAINIKTNSVKSQKDQHSFDTLLNRVRLQLNDSNMMNPLVLGKLSEIMDNDNEEAYRSLTNVMSMSGSEETRDAKSNHIVSFEIHPNQELYGNQTLIQNIKSTFEDQERQQQIFSR